MFWICGFHSAFHALPLHSTPCGIGVIFENVCALRSTPQMPLAVAFVSALALKCLSVADVRYGSVRQRTSLLLTCPGTRDGRRALASEFTGDESLDEITTLVYELASQSNKYPLASKSLDLKLCAAAGSESQCSLHCRVPCALSDSPGNFTYKLEKSGQKTQTGSRRMPRYYCPEGASRDSAKAEYETWFICVVSIFSVLGFVAVVAGGSWVYVRLKKGMSLCCCANDDPMAGERSRLRKEAKQRRRDAKRKALGVKTKKVGAGKSADAGFGHAARLI